MTPIEEVSRHPPESPRSRRSRVFMEQATEAISTLHLATQFDYRVGWGMLTAPFYWHNPADDGGAE